MTARSGTQCPRGALAICVTWKSRQGAPSLALNENGELAVRCLSYEECSTWCTDHDYPVRSMDQYGRPCPAIRETYRAIQLGYQEDSGKKVRLARDVASWFAGGRELLLWVDDWAAWPSSQHMALFTRFREALGEHRPLVEAPGHLCNSSELDDATSVLCVSLLFLWDCHVFSSGRKAVFFCSHDEWNALYVPADSDIQPLLQTFSGWMEP